MIDVYDVEDAIRTIQSFCVQYSRCVDCPLAFVSRTVVKEEDNWLGWDERKIVSHTFCPIADGTLVNKK